MVHYYVYYTKVDERGKENTFYERTCGTPGAADDRVKELKTRESIKDAFWSNDTVKGAFY